ncbi:MAG: TQO small subunit DoxD [Geodermatophilaceae bacterium]|nr:TQO small subunit DoxD [Geodermatophilaceae bacterium]
MAQDTGVRPETESRTTRILPAALRVTAGLLWLSNVGWKTPPDFGRSADGCSGLCGLVEEGSEVAVLPPWGWLLENVVSPNLAVFGYVTLAVEFLLAVLLLSGTLTRGAALLGLGQSIAIGLSVANADGEWYWSYLLMAVLHFAVFAMAAGRFYGVDALLRRRGNLPRRLEALT